VAFRVVTMQHCRWIPTLRSNMLPQFRPSLLSCLFIYKLQFITTQKRTHTTVSIPNFTQVAGMIEEHYNFYRELAIWPSSFSSRAAKWTTKELGFVSRKTKRRFHSFQMGFGAHPASHAIDIGGCFPGGKMAGA
jgi:hypothetical protein